MVGLAPLGKLLLIFGGVLVLLGLAFLYLPELPWLGRLPGDIAVRRGSFRFYFPITTSILLSLVVSLIFYLLRR